MPKLPSIQFYPGDWLKDSVSGCSLAAQGLWLRMMLVMHDSDRYGHLSQNGLAIPSDQIARRCGLGEDLATYESLLDELFRAGVPSRTRAGIIFSRRMVRDSERRAEDAERQRNYRDGKSRNGHGGVTGLSPPSSSSVSTSVSPPPPSGGKREKPKDEKNRVIAEEFANGQPER